MGRELGLETRDLVLELSFVTEMWLGEKSLSLHSLSFLVEREEGATLEDFLGAFLSNKSGFLKGN